MKKQITFYNNTDTVDIDAKSIGIGNDAQLDNRGLHIQIRHNRDENQFRIANKMAAVIVKALNEYFESGGAK